MRRSITLRITVYLILFSVLIIGFIGLGAKFLLPEYYTNYQLDKIEHVRQLVYDNYSETSPEAVIPYMEQLQQEVGGELYYYNEQGMMSKGAGQGRGRNAIAQNNSEKFIPDGNVTDYSYYNKVGIEIYAMGIAIGEEYLVYEVSVQSLDDAIGVILRFFWMMLVIILLLALIVAVGLSRNISKPIRALGQLAESMKSKEVAAVMVTNSEDEIGQLNRRLNELYEELLSSIYHLETELKKERNAENLKKRFLAQATHELKTPISVIRGYAEILYDGIYKDEDDRDRYLKHIYDETESISHLIIDVLDYTKMETGNYKLELSKVNASEYFTGTVERFRGFIESADLTATLNVNLDEQLVLSLDQNRVDQILRNLIGNAVEHSTSTVSVNIDSLGEKVRIAVANDGPSIEEEDLPYLFDSFYKKRGKQSGTGLGLAIVKEIVQLHGGDYRAENTGDGVRFLVYL